MRRLKRTPCVCSATPMRVSAILGSTRCLPLRARAGVRHILDRDDSGAVVGVLREIAAEHEKQHELDKNTQMPLEILEGLPVGVYFIDPDYRMRWTNKLGTSQSHINWKENYGEVCYALPFGLNTHCDGCPGVKSLERGDISTTEKKMPNGATWLLTAMPIYNREGVRIGAAEVVTAVSKLADERAQVLETLRLREE